MKSPKNGLVVVLCLLLASPTRAAPSVTRDEGRVTVTGQHYRVAFTPEVAGFAFDIRAADGRWHSVAEKTDGLTLAYFDGGEYPIRGQRATWALAEREDSVAVGQQVVVRPDTAMVLDLHFICTDGGVLLGARLTSRESIGNAGRLWCPPRIRLDPDPWDRYVFWSRDLTVHTGRLADLDPCPSYAGVSAWERHGDTVARLGDERPAILVQSSRWEVGLGVIFMDYAKRWVHSHAFVQRHSPGALYLYGGYSPAAAASDTLWAWLAPFSKGEVPSLAKQVETLVEEGNRLTGRFQPISRPIPEPWTRVLPDFPEDLRKTEPVRDIADAVVFTVNESTSSDAALTLARKVGSDCLIRGWFKWNSAPPVNRWRGIPSRVHEMGALFGGGITCSALYDGENGTTREETLDMATRDPAGQLVDAWDEPGTRHGSLSSPKYLDYLFRWCREQIDGGVDYLFMDEHTAALSATEGYDDYSLRDFRDYLLHHCPRTREWAPDGKGWPEELGIDLGDTEICPGGTMASFDYRAFLRAKGVIEKPAATENPMAALWGQFRSWRDDRAWKSLTDRIRAYAQKVGRTVLISANGIAKYVDLQVLGVWGNWVARDGHVDLSDSQLPVWRSIVKRGHGLAGRTVPVVLFHDWGFGDPPFPFLAAPPSEREIWMRVRGAEIYAAGGFFAFPVLGPFGCDASRDGTLSVIRRQTVFYQQNRKLYLRGRFVGSGTLESDTPDLTLAVWNLDEPRALLLHAINRNTERGQLCPLPTVTIRVPVDRAPDEAAVVSPDWEGTRSATFQLDNGQLEVTLPQLEAYSVCILRYAEIPELGDLQDPTRIVPVPLWSRPSRSEFLVGADGAVEHEDELGGFLQGMLHAHLRNPPTFLVNAKADGELRVKVRAVATLGARLEYRVDGTTQETVALPDRDGENNEAAGEYNSILTFTVPSGDHRITLDNVGADWMTIDWYEWQGEFHSR